MKIKASMQKTPLRTWVVKVDGLERQDFLSLPLGRQLDDARKVQAFKAQAKSTHVGAKHKATFATVKEWIKMMNPSQFYANWQSDSPTYKDDSVEIWYMD